MKIQRYNQVVFPNRRSGFGAHRIQKIIGNLVDFVPFCGLRELIQNLGRQKEPLAYSSFAEYAILRGKSQPPAGFYDILPRFCKWQRGSPRFHRKAELEFLLRKGSERKEQEEWKEVELFHRFGNIVFGKDRRQDTAGWANDVFSDIYFSEMPPYSCKTLCRNEMPKLFIQN